MTTVLVITIIGIIALMFGAFLLYRCNCVTEWTFRINFAILKYRYECLQKHIVPLVAFYDKENVTRTVWRFWDWNESQILPPDKYEIIRPYLEN